MDTIDFLMKRRSIRKYKSDLVPWDNIVSCINCAINAPIAGNIFNVKFIVIRDEEGRKEISKACHDQMWMAHAPVHIAIVGEPEHQKRYYGARGEKLYTIQNCAACTMSIIAAAESLGLGSCWVGSFDEDKLVSCLGLPEEVNVHAVITLGFADEKPHAPPKQWFKAAVYLEKWWAGRKVPGYGYYSENVVKVTKNAGKAIDKIAKHILGKKEEETEGTQHREKRVDEER